MADIDLYKHANGSKLFPSRTCKDLKKSQPALKSGNVNNNSKMNSISTFFMKIIISRISAYEYPKRLKTTSIDVSRDWPFRHEVSCLTSNEGLSLQMSKCFSNSSEKAMYVSLCTI